MNAVNLIPLERRRGEATGRPGTPFLGLLGALVLALAGTVSYVDVHDTVTARQSELLQVRTGAAAWSAAAGRYATAITALSQRAQGFAQLATLLGQRYDWSVLLGQIAGVMPAHAELASLSAATPIQAPATPASTGTPATASGTATTSSGTATTSSGTATTSSGTATTAAATSTTATAPTGSAITISGCAVSQPVVADTLIALRRLSGVSAVNLSSSSLQGSGSSSATGSGGCTLPVAFSLSVQFSSAPVSLPLPDVARPGSLGQDSTTGQLASSTSATGAAR